MFLKAQGKPHTEIARELGIHRRTIAEWLRLPAFASALSELRTEAHIASREALLAGAQRSIHGLIETMEVMSAVIRSDAVALSPSDRRILEAGELVRPIIDPRLQIQAARVYNQLARTFMDRAGFHSRAELHLTGTGGGGAVFDLSGVDVDEMEDDLEAELTALEENETRLRLLERGE